MGFVRQMRQSRSLNIFICMQKIREPIVMILSFLSSHWDWKSEVMPLLLSDPCFHSRNQFVREDAQVNFPQKRPLDVLEGALSCDVSPNIDFCHFWCLKNTILYPCTVVQFCQKQPWELLLVSTVGNSLVAQAWHVFAGRKSKLRPSSQIQFVAMDLGRSNAYWNYCSCLEKNQFSGICESSLIWITLTYLP